MRRTLWWMGGGAVRPDRQRPSAEREAPGPFLTAIARARDRIRTAGEQVRDRRADGVDALDTVEQLVDEVVALVGSEASVALLEEGVAVRRAGTAGVEHLLGRPVGTAGTACGETLRSGRLVRTGEADGGLELSCCPGSRAHLSVPIGARRGDPGSAPVMLGLLTLTRNRPDAFHELDEQAAILLAEAAVPALTLALTPVPTPATVPATAPGATGAPTAASTRTSIPASTPSSTPASTEAATHAPGPAPALAPAAAASTGTVRTGAVPAAVRSPLATPPGGLVPDTFGSGWTARTSLAGLRAARELTGLGLWEWRPDTGQLAWSPEMYRFLGLEPDAVPPSLDVWHAAVHPEDLARARRLDALAVSREVGGVETFRLLGADGVERYVQSWSTVVAEDGEPVAVCGATLDVTRQVRNQRLLERLSETDAVTGLGNRLAFDRRMQELLAGWGGTPSGGSRPDVALLLLDLDRFKLVNDSLGHQVGDRLLVEVARRIEAELPEGAVTARMGGDEFVVVPPPGLGWLHVRRLAQGLVDTLRAPYVLPDSGEVLVCPASIGVTSTAGRRVSAHDLLSEADLALYRAKDSGRDRYVVYDEALRRRAQGRHRAERQLRAALDEGRLVLQYQPIVDFAHGRVVGAEALVRLRKDRPGSGSDLLGPDGFIDVAEDTGLVVELDCWVIDTAVAQVARWMAETPRGRPVPWLAVNVSPRSMEHPRVVRRLLDAVQQHGVAADLLKVELTEHSFLGTLPGGEAALRQLISSGIPVGIDDFGTGYSALAYLPRFDLDFMKIDRSFVAAVGQEERADAVVTAIVDLAHAHGMRVTAEGIETARQARRLREIGCDLAQGFHFGRAGDPERILHA